MSTTIAAYYTDELADWNDAISFYTGEIEEMENKLGEVINRNTILGIAAKVEGEQEMLNRVSDTFYRFKMEIAQQEALLKTNSTLVDNSFISNETESRQHDLRRKMQAIEKEYIDVKFECYNFLSGTLMKKKD